jgi:hypothetical protein
MINAEEMTAAIQGLYATFSRYPRPAKIEYCPCGCTKPSEVLSLLAVPLDELRFEDLGNYSTSAMTTQGSVEDFKYFLPRLLDGIAREQYGFNPEMLFGKLSYAKWRSWNEKEINAVRTFLISMWRVGILSFPLEQAFPAFFEVETLIASIANTGEDLKPYLDIWDQANVQEADQHLVQFITQFGADFENGHTLEFGFWERLQESAEALRTWVLQPATIDHIARSRYLLPLDGYEHLFDPATEILQAESKARNL